MNRAAIIALPAASLAVICVYLSLPALAGEGFAFPLDDSWIHQTYARSLAQTGQWAFLPGQPSAGSTAPLWTLCLAAGYALGVDSLLWSHGLGCVLLAMGDAPSAARRFTRARELAASQKFPALVCETAAGLAACAILQGQLDEAGNYVHEAWEYLKEDGWLGLNNPSLVYRLCAETFGALGNLENARAVLESGRQAILEVADKIQSPAWRQSYLENVPDNRAIIEMWERRI